MIHQILAQNEASILSFTLFVFCFTKTMTKHAFLVVVIFYVRYTDLSQ